MTWRERAVFCANRNRLLELTHTDQGIDGFKIVNRFRKTFCSVASETDDELAGVMQLRPIK